AGNTNSSSTRNFTIITTAPTINFVSPGPNAYLNSTNQTFTFNYTSSSPTANCSLYINGVLNITNATVANNTATSFNLTGLPIGSDNWSISCTDLAGNTNSSATRNFTIITTAPTINFVSPGPNAYLNSTNQTFTFNYTSSSPTANCSLYINGVLNITNATVANNTATSFNLTGLPIGSDNWSISCTDLAGNTNSSQTRNFTIITTAPTINFVSPGPNAYLNSTNQTLTFNYTSSSPTANCSLYINGVLNITNATVANNTATSFNVTGLPIKLDNWSISCTDLAGNTNSSATRNFTIDTTPPVITLNNPNNSTFFNVTTVNLNFTATESISPNMTCSLILDGVQNITNASVSNNTLTNWQVTGLSQATHTWYTNCTDAAGNQNLSQ